MNPSACTSLAFLLIALKTVGAASGAPEPGFTPKTKSIPKSPKSKSKKLSRVAIVWIVVIVVLVIIATVIIVFFLRKRRRNAKRMEGSSESQNLLEATHGKSISGLVFSSEPSQSLEEQSSLGETGTPTLPEETHISRYAPPSTNFPRETLGPLKSEAVNRRHYYQSEFDVAKKPLMSPTSKLEKFFFGSVKSLKLPQLVEEQDPPEETAAQRRPRRTFPK